MPLDIGFNFRNSLAYVTDGANEYFVEGPNTYSTTFGSTSAGFSTAINDRDRNSSNDRRVAGCAFTANSVAPTFRVDLDTTGDHDIYLAYGDPGAANGNQYWEMFDNVTSFANSGALRSLASDEYIDASGVTRTSASDWVTNNVKITRTFASTTFFIQCGDGAASGNCAIAHLRIVEVGGGGGGDPVPEGILANRSLWHITR